MAGIRKYFWLIMLAVQIVVLKVLSFFPEIIERYYSNGIYPPISSAFRILLGWIPFSVGDVIYLAAIAWIMWRAIIYRKNIRQHWKRQILVILNVVSIVYLAFNLLWGINYIRVPLNEKLQIGTEYSDEELLHFTKNLIVKSNQLHSDITGNDSLKVVFNQTKTDVMKLNLIGYHNLSTTYPEFSYSHSSVKKSLISLPLSYMGFAGYLNPFTNEAQVNDMLPDYSFAATSCHEMAHQIGFASESEANFVGYLAAINNENKMIQYSGYTLALRYCMANWEIRNENTARKLEATINHGILENFRESRDFWTKYETFIEEGFHIFYDKFLKLNQQDEGLESYSRFVDLLVNYYRGKKL